MSFPYMPFYIGDHLRDVTHLTHEEHSVYLHLIFRYWSNGSLPDDDQQLARIAGFKSVKQWLKIKPIIQEFFHDGWHHKRIDAELAKVNSKSDKRQEAANARWEKVRANAMQMHKAA